MSIKRAKDLQPGDIYRQGQRLMEVTRIGRTGEPQAWNEGKRMLSIYARECLPSEELVFWETDIVTVTAEA